MCYVVLLLGRGPASPVQDRAGGQQRRAGSRGSDGALGAGVGQVVVVMPVVVMLVVRRRDMLVRRLVMLVRRLVVAVRA